jgi:hypothetical protein
MAKYYLEVYTFDSATKEKEELVKVEGFDGVDLTKLANIDLFLAKTTRVEALKILSLEVPTITRMHDTISIVKVYKGVKSYLNVIYDCKELIELISTISQKGYGTGTYYGVSARNETYREFKKELETIIDTEDYDGLENFCLPKSPLKFKVKKCWNFREFDISPELKDEAFKELEKYQTIRGVIAKRRTFKKARNYVIWKDSPYRSTSEPLASEIPEKFKTFAQRKAEVSAAKKSAKTKKQTEAEIEAYIKTCEEEYVNMIKTQGPGSDFDVVEHNLRTGESLTPEEYSIMFPEEGFYRGYK